MVDPANAPPRWDIDRVIADDLRFRRKLHIGEDAYVVLKAKNRMNEVWAAITAGQAGAAIAASAPLASVLFPAAAPTGIAAWLGLAAPAVAVTPVGWVVAAGVAAASGYFGVSRLLFSGPSAFTETIPKFISAPIDILAAQLFDLYGALALRVAAIDGVINPSEVAAISAHFVEDWGYDTAYVAKALEVLAAEAERTRVKDLAHALAQVLAVRPDCNADAMLAEVMDLLREIVAADGVYDEREELALDAIAAVFRAEATLSFAKVGRSISETASTFTGAAGEIAGHAGLVARRLVARAVKVAPTSTS